MFSNRLLLRMTLLCHIACLILSVLVVAAVVNR